MLKPPTPTSTHKIPPARLYQWHRHAPQKPAQPRPRDSGAYIPDLSERLERDPNLTDGARRCARLIAAYAYRRNRAGRTAAITVSYLAEAMARSRRSVQRYLRELERFGYIAVDVVIGHRSRLCTGLVIALLKPLFARHHKQKWPEKAMFSGATKAAQNYRPVLKQGPRISRRAWDERCRDGGARVLCQNLPPLPF